ncbi:MAG: T9SS type A sorting domain-containing protein [Calditrichae bacterium]|nr:T9SS type A sorting domain-containing protein [Calditrichia bacterium]
MYDTNPSVSFNNFGTWSEATEVIWYYERIPVKATPAIGTAIGIGGNLVTEFRLAQNYPNPFNPSTTIAFDLKQASGVTLEVFNTLGQSVATLVNDKMTAGSHEVTFDASNLASGVYLYRLTADELTLTKKMMLMK